MQVMTQQKYRRIINQFKQPFSNLISQYPIKLSQAPNARNLKYIIQKQSISANLSYDDNLYENIFQNIKRNIAAQTIQHRIFAIRLSRSLPFSYRINIIEELQNDIIKLAISPKNASQSPVKRKQTIQNISNSKEKEKIIEIVPSKHQFSYEIVSDIIDLMLSVYQLTHFSQEIYFDVNQRIISIFTRIIQNGYNSQQAEVQRNMYECIRSIFYLFGSNVYKKDQDQKQLTNKLINKLVTYFAPNNSFVSKGGNLSSTANNSVVMISQKSYSNKLFHLILRIKQFQARIRSRFLYGLCCLSTYSQQPSQIIDLLIKQIFIILENVNQCDINIECFNGIKAILNSKNIDFHARTCLIKKWTSTMSQIAYKKQYLQYFIALLNSSSSQISINNRILYQCPLRIKYYIGMSFLEISKNIQQQYSRFIIYKLTCKNIMSVNKQLNLNSNQSSPKSMIILNIFQYSWFLDRIKQETDLFRSQFLISLLQSFFTIQKKVKDYSKNQIKDLISLCHILLDWKCSSRQDAFMPTIKFAFDMYLSFLKVANQVLQQQIEQTIEELIQKCNDTQNIYFLFRFKLISTIVSLQWYQNNSKFLTKVKFNFNYLNDQIRISIMPKNSKPIFDFVYSQSADGIAESRRQIQFVKIITQLLINLQKVHQDMYQMVQKIQIDYHGFLNQLQMDPNSNKDLIYCLQTGTADQYFSPCQRDFLLSLIDQYDSKGNNFELNLDNNILYSPYQTFESQDEINIFGPMSPVQLTVKLYLHNSYSSVYIEVKKNNWVSTPKLKLLISSGMEKKQMNFESSIIEMKIDRVGNIHFEVWTADGNQLLIGSGNLKIKRKLKWRKVSYLSIIDGIKRKSYFKKSQSLSNDGKQCYLSYYYGEPLLVQIFRNGNQVVFGVSSKEIWNELQSCLPQIIQEFTDGSADIFQ